MRRLSFVFCACSILTFTTALPVPVHAQATAPAGAVVVTHGEAVLQRAPDRAWLAVSVETRDAKAAEARRKNAEAMTAVQGMLKASNLPADAIRTTGYSLAPDMDFANGRSTLKGYIVRNDIDVRVDDLDKLSSLLDVINVQKGIGLTVVGPRFDLKNSQSADNDALRQAVEIAMARAQALAAGARRSMGAVIRIEDQESASLPRPIPMMAMQAKSADMSTPITPGQIEVRASVTLTVELR